MARAPSPRRTHLATACAVRFVRGICRHDISVWGYRTTIHLSTDYPPPTIIYQLPTQSQIIVRTYNLIQQACGIFRRRNDEKRSRMPGFGNEIGRRGRRCPDAIRQLARERDSTRCGDGHLDVREVLGVKHPIPPRLQNRPPVKQPIHHRLPRLRRTILPYAAMEH